MTIIYFIIEFLSLLIKDHYTYHNVLYFLPQKMCWPGKHNEMFPGIQYYIIFHKTLINKFAFVFVENQFTFPSTAGNVNVTDKSDSTEGIKMFKEALLRKWHV